MFCPSDGNIHSSQVGSEAQNSFSVRTYAWKDNNVFLSALVSIDGIDLYVVLWILNFSKLSQECKDAILQGPYLTLVWWNDTNQSFEVVDCFNSLFSEIIVFDHLSLLCKCCFLKLDYFVIMRSVSHVTEASIGITLIMFDQLNDKFPN